MRESRRRSWSKGISGSHKNNKNKKRVGIKIEQLDRLRDSRSCSRPGRDPEIPVVIEGRHSNPLQHLVSQHIYLQGIDRQGYPSYT